MTVILVNPTDLMKNKIIKRKSVCSCYPFDDYVSYKYLNLYFTQFPPAIRLVNKTDNSKISFDVE